MINQPGEGGGGLIAPPVNNNAAGSDPLQINNPPANIPGSNDPNAAPEQEDPAAPQPAGDV